eukprot:m51a1_g4805 hypothetical protein (916) ;mRNA; f:118634-123217
MKSLLLALFFVACACAISTECQSAINNATALARKCRNATMPDHGGRDRRPPPFCNSSSECSPDQFDAVIGQVKTACKGKVPTAIRGSLSQFSGGSRARCAHDDKGDACMEVFRGLVDIVHNLTAGTLTEAQATALLDTDCQSECLSKRIQGAGLMTGFPRGPEIAMGIHGLACSKDSEGNYCLIEFVKLDKLIRDEDKDAATIAKKVCSACLRNVSGRLGRIGLPSHVPRFTQVCDGGMDDGSDRSEREDHHRHNRSCMHDALDMGDATGLFRRCDPRGRHFNRSDCIDNLHNFSDHAGCCSRQALPFIPDGGADIPDFGFNITEEMGRHMPPPCTRDAGDKVFKAVVRLAVANADWDALQASWASLASNVTSEVAVVVQAESSDAIATRLDAVAHEIVVEFLPTGTTYTAQSVLSTINTADLVLDPTTDVTVSGATASLELVSEPENAIGACGIAAGLLAAANASALASQCLNVTAIGGDGGPDRRPPPFCNSSSECSPDQFDAVIGQVKTACGGKVPAAIRGSLSHFSGGGKARCAHDDKGDACMEVFRGLVDIVHNLTAGTLTEAQATALLDTDCQSECLSKKIQGMSLVTGFPHGPEIAMGIHGLACSKDSEGNYCLIEFVKLDKLIRDEDKDASTIAKKVCSACLRNVSGRLGSIGLPAHVPRFTQVCEDGSNHSEGEDRGQNRSCMHDALDMGDATGLFRRCDPRGRHFNRSDCIDNLHNFSDHAGCCSRQALPFIPDGGADIPDFGFNITEEMGRHMPPPCTRDAGDKVFKAVVRLAVANADWDALQASWASLASNVTSEVAVVVHAESSDAIATRLDAVAHEIVVEFLPTGTTYTAQSVVSAVTAAVTAGTAQLSTINKADFVLDPTTDVTVPKASASLELVSDTEDAAGATGVAAGLLAVAAALGV